MSADNAAVAPSFNAVAVLRDIQLLAVISNDDQPGAHRNGLLDRFYKFKL